MKQFLSAFVLIVFLLGGIVFFYSRKYQLQSTQQQQPPTTSPPSPRTVFFPSGGETLIKGQTYLLKWTEGAGDLQIFLVDKNLESQGESVSIVDQVFDVPNTGSYSYTVPENTPSSTYIIKIGNLSSQPFQITDAKNSPTAFCKPADLAATITYEGAAGSTYGSLILKNISPQPCNIQGNHYIKPVYSASNIEVREQELVDLSTIVLQPNQSVYSQIRYTNGAQCSGPTKPVVVTFQYTISPSIIVSFKDQASEVQHTIPTCQDSEEITELLVWGVFDQPLNK